MGNTTEFEPVISLLSEQFSYLTIDLPGHGKTQVLGGDECYTMANIAQALIALLDKLNIAKCFLVGYSMGGRLALYLTLHFPERFVKVVLESASPGLKTEAERLERVKRDLQIARKLERSTAREDFLAFLSFWYKQPIFGEINQHPEFEQMIENRLQNNPIGFAKSLRFMGTGCQPSLWEKLGNNNIPLLLLAGGYDDKFIQINREMAKKSDCTKLEIINHAGHNIHFENPAAFVESVSYFFRK
jgi:2-succinyl-6-hydroxy-2,4-cyclohexadiene-1-carboxylate synthase